MREPYLAKILSGEKGIESRFSKIKHPPFLKVNSGDLILFKLCSGPIKAISLVHKVEYVGPMKDGEANLLMNRYQACLQLDDDFINAKQDSVYASLIYIDSAEEIKPFSLIKKDRRGWVVLQNAN